ncbi:MAG TPA: hypothetical protein VK206_23455 [Anaerolineales bacterium]|nr:hypothetical protein [Anaerolineales bacterium]
MFNLPGLICATAITAYRTLGAIEGEYGTWQLYIIVKDKEGNQSKSLLDRNMRLLAYVDNPFQGRTLVSFSSMQGGDPM